MELEAFNIQFDYIKGSNNILADTLSRLISIDPDTPTMPEEPGYEFGYAIFEEFPKVTTKTYEVNEVIVGTNTEIFKNDPELQNSLQCIENPIAPQKLQRLQQQDTNIKILKCKLRNNRLDKEYYSLDENKLLTRKVIDGGHEFHAIYLPSVLIFQVYGNNVEIQDYRGTSMVHITDVKKITLTEQVADEYENLGKEGRFSKKCIPRGYIPDFDWTTIHPSQDQPIKPIQQQDPTEDTTTPAAPTEVEGPPSSCL